MKRLNRFSEYSRKDLFDLFASKGRFSPGAGTWGLQGIIPIPDREGSYLFLVTQNSGDKSYRYGDKITEDGFVIWHTQNRHSFKSKFVRNLISHDDEIRSIYLFVRKDAKRDYAFLGALKYISHNPTQQNPCVFYFQINEGPVPAHQAKRIGVELVKDAALFPIVQSSARDHRAPEGLSETPKPKGKQDLFSGASSFATIKSGARSRKEERQKEIGDIAEELVLAFEIDELEKKGLAELALKVKHISKVEGDGAGYDVLSFFEDGSPKYIEVKATTGPAGSPFFISARELEFSRLNNDSYELIRVYGLDTQRKSGFFWRLSGDVSALCHLEPRAFRAVLRSKNASRS